MGEDPFMCNFFRRRQAGHDFRYSICNKKVRNLNIADPTDFDKSLSITVLVLRQGVENDKVVCGSFDIL